MTNPKRLICIDTEHYEIIDDLGIEEAGEIKRIRLKGVYTAILTANSNTLLTAYPIEELQAEILRRSPLGKALE